MSEKLRKALDIAVSAAIVVSAVCFVFLVYLHFRPNQDQRANIPIVTASTIARGEHFPVSTFDQSHNGALVFALQIGCHFCQESMPFYKTLTQQAMNSGRTIVYVFPNPIADSRAYLKQSGLPEGNLIQSDLRNIKVAGTPTLILLDNKNTVENVWIGKLSPERQKQVETAISPAKET
jgi:hypothetical protein